MKTQPDPSKCDLCAHAGHVGGGYASIGEYDCPQRYCSVLHIAIHFDGKQECEEFIPGGV